jgi:hypothetical protein
MANNNQVIIEKAPTERVLREMFDAIADSAEKGMNWRGSMMAVYNVVIAHGAVK